MIKTFETNSVIRAYNSLNHADVAPKEHKLRGVNGDAKIIQQGNTAWIKILISLDEIAETIIL